MKKMKFTARSKKGATKFFTFCVEGEIKWPKTENPTKSEIIQQIKEHCAADWTRGPYHFTPNDITVKLGA